MLSSALSVLSLLALHGAHAADLDLRISSDGVGSTSVTLRDVKPGALPSVELPGPDGRSMRVDMLLTESELEGAPAYDLSFTVTRRAPVGRKKVHEEVARPTVRFRPNEQAMVSAGGRAPIAGTEPMQYQELNSYRIQMLLRTEPGAP